MDHYDVVVVGAGVWGLCAAHTFLTINPALSLLIVDGRKSIGGVWADEQLYPGLQSNNLQGYYEFSDFPILEADVGVSPRGFLSGQALNAYLKKYAEHYGLTSRIRLATQVVQATENDSSSNVGWEIVLRNTDEDRGVSVTTISCEKLVLATGQTSTPYMHPFKGLNSTFQKPVLHTANLSKMGSTIIDDEDIKDVTVVGGSKSAHDAVYMFASAGKHVNWIIHSPATPMAKLFSKMGPWSLWIEPFFILRPLTWFGAAPWGDGDGFGWIKWLLHSTAAGNSLVKSYFKTLVDQIVQGSGIMDDDNPNTKALLPEKTFMWYGTQGASIHYDTDFYKLVRSEKVSVKAGEIDHLEDNQVHMLDSTVFETDTLVLATGYDYSATVALEPAGKRLGWGCPVDPSGDVIYPVLDKQSDKDILARFHLLRDSPAKPERLPALTPWRLWRFLAPPSQVPTGPRNLVFLNAINCYQNLMKSEITSLWAYAYLFDCLTIHAPSEDEIQREVSLWTRFEKLSTPYGMRGKMADFGLDSLSYYDRLLRDLGLPSWRKGWGWLGEVFGGAYMPKDYSGIVREWMAMQAESKNGDKKKKEL